MKMNESFVDLSKGVRYGASGWFEAFTDDLGELFRALRSEYGRCVSKVYVDATDGKVRAVGWVFVKRVEYTDSAKTYLREVWVEVEGGLRLQRDA